MVIIATLCRGDDYMSFRRDALRFSESIILSISLIILCLVIIPYQGLQGFLLGVVPTIFFNSIFLTSYKEYVTIDEAGISCMRSGKVMWQYEWTSIAELRKGSLFLRPAVFIILYDKSGKPEQFPIHDHYFQLGKQAKEALKIYYRPTEIDKH